MPLLNVAGMSLSLADNNAALLDSVNSTVPSNNQGAGAATPGASVAYGSSSTASKSLVMDRIDPDLLEHLVELDEKRKATNAINANVTVEELGEVPTDSSQEKKDQ